VCAFLEVVVTYVPDWEPLANALRRVLATSSSEPDAKADLCNAVADKKIAIRILVADSDPDVGSKTLAGAQVEIPPRLGPKEFDWARSRPVRPWRTGPTSVVEHYDPTWSWKPREIALIELATADIASVLCGGGRSSPAEFMPSPGEAAYAGLNARYRPRWVPAAEAIAYIAEMATVGDLAAAAVDLLAAIRDSEIRCQRRNGDEIRREAIQQGVMTPGGVLLWGDDYYTIGHADGSTSPRQYVYSDLEVLRQDIENLWPRHQRPKSAPIALLSPGPKSGETSAAAVAWEIAIEILEHDDRMPRRAHGRLMALARAVQPLLKERGYSRELDTIAKDLRPSLREWEAKNPDKLE
jgi:hypothetical protein